MGPWSLRSPGASPCPAFCFRSKAWWLWGYREIRRLFLLLSLWEQPEQRWAGVMEAQSSSKWVWEGSDGTCREVQGRKDMRWPRGRMCVCVCVCVCWGSILRSNVDPSLIYSFSCSLTNIYGALPVFQASVVNAGHGLQKQTYLLLIHALPSGEHGEELM